MERALSCGERLCQRFPFCPHTLYSMYDVFYLVYLRGSAHGEAGLFRNRPVPHKTGDSRPRISFECSRSRTKVESTPSPRVTHGPRRTRVTHAARSAPERNVLRPSPLTVGATISTAVVSILSVYQRY